MKKRLFKTVSLVLVLLFSINLNCFATNYQTRKIYDYQNSSSTASNDFMNAATSTQRWSSTVKNYVYNNGDGTFTVLDATQNPISAKRYSLNSFNLKSTKKIDYELDLFGGFYAGKNYNYIAFGQNNKDEDNSKVVIKVVKYDKNFHRIASFKLTDCYTIEPFRAASLRMAEYENKLTIHTSRLRYTTEDGLNHQSQLTFTIDTNTMTLLTDNVGPFQSNHVSHSFNQFVKYDGAKCIYVDHGDAYPRSVVLTEAGGREADLFDIPGSTGANCTGVTIGGFEVAKNNYLVAINSIDHSKVTNYTSFTMNGLDIDERNVILLVCDKKTLKTKQVFLSWYIDQSKLASTPYLVKLSDNRFVVMWEQYKYEKNNYGGMTQTQKGLRYVYIDENGNLLSDVQSEPEMRLSKDCKPEYINGKIMWFADDGEKRHIYTIRVVGDHIKNTLYTDIVAKINGHDIASYNIDGYTGVVAEDLANYGFDVRWDPNTKSLYIDRHSNKPKVVSNYVAQKPSSTKLGKKAHDILYTDIKTYVNGNLVTGYNINGKTIIRFDSLACYGSMSYDNNTRQITLKVSGLK